MKNYIMFRVMRAVITSAMLTACNKGTHLHMGNASSSSSSSDEASLVQHYDDANCSYPIEQKRERIAYVAECYVGAVDWGYDLIKDDFPADRPKCNKFVYDVLSKANARPLLKIGSKWPLTAEDWATGNYASFGWMNMGSDADWERGDVIAKKIKRGDATGHCAIAVNSFEVVGAGTYDVTQSDHGLRGGTVVRYIGIGED